MTIINMNLSIKTFLRNFKIDKNYIVNFKTFQNVLQTLCLILE